MKVRIYYKNGLDETLLNIEQIVDDGESVIVFYETPQKRGYMTTPKKIIEKLIVEV